MNSVNSFFYSLLGKCSTFLRRKCVIISIILITCLVLIFFLYNILSYNTHKKQFNDFFIRSVDFRDYSAFHNEAILHYEDASGIFRCLYLAYIDISRIDFDEREVLTNHCHNNMRRYFAFSNMLSSLLSDDANLEDIEEIINKYKDKDENIIFFSKFFLASLLVKNNELDKAKKIIDDIKVFASGKNLDISAYMKHLEAMDDYIFFRSF